MQNQNPNPNQPYNNMYQPPNFQQQVPMKPCKHCKQMIDKKATVCPYCRKKQGVSGCLSVVVVAVALFIFVPSCTGYMKKASENGSVRIDSNGETSPVIDRVETEQQTTESEFSYEISDTIFKYYPDSLGNTKYNGILEITNTGQCSIELRDCTFDIEDNDGHLLQTDRLISSCPDVIAPGEKGYFYNNIGSSYIDEDVSLDNGVNLVPNYKIEKTNKMIVDYEVTDTDMREDGYGNIKVTGRIKNTTEKDDSYLYIHIIFKDSSGKILAIFGTSVTDVPSGSTKSFETSSWFADDTISIEDVATYEIVARP